MSKSATNITTWRRRYTLATAATCLAAALWALTCVFELEVMDWPAWSVSVSGGHLGLSRGMTPMTWQWPWEWSLVPALNAPQWLPSFCNDYPWYIDWIPFTPRWSVGVPLWPTPVAFGALAWYAGRRIKRLRQGACTKCGYHTHGLAEGACCPECGTACTV